jgi:zinc transporter 1
VPADVEPPRSRSLRGEDHGHSHGSDAGHGHSHGSDAGHGHSHGSDAGHGHSHSHTNNDDTVIPFPEDLDVVSDSGVTPSAAPRKQPARDMNEHGVFLHVLGDALGSVGVIGSALIMMFAPGRYRFLCDPIVSLVIVAIIARSAIPLTRRCISVLLHSVPLSVSARAEVSVECGMLCGC